MINHYQSASERDAFVSRFGIEHKPQPHLLMWPGQFGTFVRRPRADHPGSSALARFEASSGRWGLIPLFSKDGQDPLFEAQAETAFGERNFYQPWKRGHRCVVLADAVFEDDAQSGTVVRRTRADGKPLGIAGLWNGWRSPEGQCVESFAMFTVSAGDDQAPQRRKLAILRDAWLDDWLSCPVEETAAFLRAYPDAELTTSRPVTLDAI